MRRPLTLPFAHLNLRRNPFGELTQDARPALAVLDPAPYLQLLAEPRATLLFLGDKGRGKTTHLLTIRAARAGTYVHLPEDGPLPTVPVGLPLLYLDECQRLSRRTRRRLFRGSGALVLASHEDHGAELRAAGRVVTRVEVGELLTIERLDSIVSRRIDAARRGPGSTPRVPLSSLKLLVARYGDDVRSIEHHLYERFQALEEPCDVQV